MLHLLGVSRRDFRDHFRPSTPPPAQDLFDASHLSRSLAAGREGILKDSGIMVEWNIHHQQRKIWQDLKERTLKVNAIHIYLLTLDKDQLWWLFHLKDELKLLQGPQKSVVIKTPEGEHLLHELQGDLDFEALTRLRDHLLDTRLVSLLKDHFRLPHDFHWSWPLELKKKLIKLGNSGRDEFFMGHSLAQVSGKHLKINANGLNFIRLLSQKFGLCYHSNFFQQWSQIKEVLQENQNFTALLSDFYEVLEQSSLNLKKALEEWEVKSSLSCPQCRQGDLMLKNHYGREYLACNRYPECFNTEEMMRGEGGKIELLPKRQSKLLCPGCENLLIIKQQGEARVLRCDVCSYRRPFPLDQACPGCGAGELVERLNRFGQLFYGCSQYPKCEMIVDPKKEESCHG